jgi:hypothetical protein
MPCQQAPIHREKKAPAFFLRIATVSASTFAGFASIHRSHRKITFSAKSARSVAMVGCESAEKIVPNLAISCSN